MSNSSKIRVLLVDDHLAVRLGVGTIINDQEDMEVAAEAANGASALEIFSQIKPDVVLLDLRMPAMSGLEVLKEMIARFGDPKVIVLTTHDREEDIYQALEAGAVGYLLKDMRKDDLVEAVRKVYSGEHWISPAAAARLAERVHHPPLSPRESEVLALIVAGKSNKEIAVALSVSEDTIKWHMKSLFTKLDVADRTQAAVTAIQRGLVQV